MPRFRRDRGNEPKSVWEFRLLERLSKTKPMNDEIARLKREKEHLSDNSDQLSRLRKILGNEMGKTYKTFNRRLVTEGKEGP